MRRLDLFKNTIRSRLSTNDGQRNKKAEATTSSQGRSDCLAMSALDLEWGAADQVHVTAIHELEDLRTLPSGTFCQVDSKG